MKNKIYGFLSASVFVFVFVFSTALAKPAEADCALTTYCEYPCANGMDWACDGLKAGVACTNEDSCPGEGVNNKLNSTKINIT